jgi:hypothetical protein
MILREHGGRHQAQHQQTCEWQTSALCFSWKHFRSLLELRAFGALTPFIGLQAFRLRASLSPQNPTAKYYFFSLLFFKPLWDCSLFSRKSSAPPFASGHTWRYDASRTTD